jgi:hypothetical protein
MWLPGLPAWFLMLVGACVVTTLAIGRTPDVP